MFTVCGKCGATYETEQDYQERTKVQLFSSTSYGMCACGNDLTVQQTTDPRSPETLKEKALRETGRYTEPPAIKNVKWPSIDDQLVKLVCRVCENEEVVPRHEADIKSGMSSVFMCGGGKYPHMPAPMFEKTFLEKEEEEARKDLPESIEQMMYAGSPEWREFCKGEQWSFEDLLRFKNEDRPALTLNKITPSLSNPSEILRLMDGQALIEYGDRGVHYKFWLNGRVDKEASEEWRDGIIFNRVPGIINVLLARIRELEEEVKKTK